MQGLTKLADLILLNFLTAICCLPVITIGASLTAMNYVALKIVRDEESYIIKTFFRSFKDNFKQATLLWLIHLLVIALLVYDYGVVYYALTDLPFWAGPALLSVTGVLYLLSLHIFPLQAKFVNKIFKTIKNSALIGIMTFPKTILMGILWAIPVLITIYLPQVMPLVILFGFSGPAYISALLYNKTFKRFEPEVAIASDEEWHVEEEAPSSDAETAGIQSPVEEPDL